MDAGGCDLLTLATDVRRKQRGLSRRGTGHSLADRVAEVMRLETLLDESLARHNAAARLPALKGVFIGVPGGGVVPSYFGDLESRKMAAVAVADLLGVVVGELGFAFSYNLDESTEGENVPGVAKPATALSCLAARLAAWSSRQGTENENVSNITPGGGTTLCATRGPTVPSVAATETDPGDSSDI